MRKKKVVLAVVIAWKVAKISSAVSIALNILMYLKSASRISSPEWSPAEVSDSEIVTVRSLSNSVKVVVKSVSAT